MDQLIEEFPDIEVESVEFLTNRRKAKNARVNSIPTLVCDEKQLSGFYLTKERIRKFFESLSENAK